MTKERAKNVFGKTLSYWENKVYTECVINLLCIILSFFLTTDGCISYNRPGIK